MLARKRSFMFTVFAPLACQASTFGLTDGMTASEATHGSTGVIGTTGATGSSESPTSTIDPDEVSTGAHAGASTGTPPSVCGDGILAVGELCDDGNSYDADGCAADCQTAHCLVPVSHVTIQAAADDPGCPTIWIVPDTYYENVVIDRNVVVEELPLGDVIVDGGEAGAVFTIGGGAVTLRGLTVTHGLRGIVNDGELLLDDTTVEFNVMDGPDASGAGIYSTGALTLSRSRVRDNLLDGVTMKDGVRGAGIFTTGPTLLITQESEISNNTITAANVPGSIDEWSLGAGGGVYARGASVTITYSAVADNLIDLTVEDGDGVYDVQGGGLYVSGGPVLVSDSVIEHNTASVSGTNGALGGMGSTGGGLYIDSTSVELRSGTVISDNAALATADSTGGAGASAGGIFLGTSKSVTIEGAMLVNNEARASTNDISGFAMASGGLLVGNGGDLSTSITIVESTVAENRASAMAPDGMYALARGGAVLLWSGTSTDTVSLSVLRSTFSTNAAMSPWKAIGGAIFATAGTGNARVDLTLINSTLSGNTATEGGALAADSGVGNAWTTAQLYNITVTGNTATTGGGLSATRGGDTAKTYVHLQNSIVAGNQADSGADCWSSEAVIDSGGYNLFGSEGDCPMVGDTASNIVSADPMLGPLADNGGPTLTHELAAESPATDAANPGGCFIFMNDPFLEDQRGEPRLAGPRCDIGAYERQR